MSRLKYLRTISFFACAAAGFACAPAASQPVPAGARELPSRSIPVPDTVSPQMQAIIARPLDPDFNLVPQTTAEWKATVAEAALDTVARLPSLLETPAVT